MIDCDIVILTKDRPEYVRHVKDGINKQEGIKANIVLLDNGEDEASSCAQENWLAHSAGEQYKHWHYLKSQVSGFANGVNQAVNFLPSKAPILFLINDDVRFVESSTLSAMAAHLGPANTAIAGVRVLYNNQTINHDGTSFSEGRPFHMGRTVDPKTVDNVCALTPATTFACVAIQREVFDELGGLNEDYGWGSEDVDFCLTAAEHGYRTMTCRKTHVLHDEFGTRKPGADTREMNYFFGKWSVTGRGMEALRNLDWPLVDACQING